MTYNQKTVAVCFAQVVVVALIVSLFGVFYLASKVGDLRHRAGRAEVRLRHDEALLRQLCLAVGHGASSVGPVTIRGGKVSGSTVASRTGCAR